MQLTLGHAIQDVEEMSALCRDLLASDVSELNDAIVDFAGATTTAIFSFDLKPSRRVIECLREADMHLPDQHSISFALSLSLFTRFIVTWSNDDYEDAMAGLDKIISSHSHTNNPNSYATLAFHQAPLLVMCQFAFYGDPEYLEEAISRFRGHLGTMSLEDPLRNDAIQSLEALEKRRFEEFGVTSGFQAAHCRDPQVLDPPSFSDLAASLSKSNGVKFSSMTM